MSWSQSGIHHLDHQKLETELCADAKLLTSALLTPDSISYCSELHNELNTQICRLESQSPRPKAGCGQTFGTKKQWCLIIFTLGERSLSSFREKILSLIFRLNSPQVDMSPEVQCIILRFVCLLQGNEVNKTGTQCSTHILINYLNWHPAGVTSLIRVLKMWSYSAPT